MLVSRNSKLPVSSHGLSMTSNWQSLLPASSKYAPQSVYPCSSSRDCYIVITGSGLETAYSFLEMKTGGT